MLSYINCIDYISDVGRLYELYELCKLHEYFMKHLKSLEIA